MNPSLTKLSPSITKLIRHDHTRVLGTFHKISLDTPAPQKQALFETIAALLEIHAQLEEEILYPKLREVAPDNEAVRKAQPEHDEMKRLVGELRGLEAGDEAFDLKLNELMRDVMHHVADEETVMLPAAEIALKDQLAELGAQYTKRQLELAGPRAGEIGSSLVRGMPGTAMLMAGGLLAGGYLLKRAFETRRH
jgi:hemerythrin superfamily protein